MHHREQRQPLISNPLKDIETSAARHLQIEHKQVGQRMDGPIGKLPIPGQILDGFVTTGQRSYYSQMRGLGAAKSQVEENPVVLRIIN